MYSYTCFIANKLFTELSITLILKQESNPYYHIKIKFLVKIVQTESLKYISKL